MTDPIVDTATVYMVWDSELSLRLGAGVSAVVSAVVITVMTSLK